MSPKARIHRHVLLGKASAELTPVAREKPKQFF